MKRSIKPAAGHWFSWRPRSYIPARSSTSCYTLCKPFSQPSVYWRLDSKRASSRLQKEHMTKLLKISLILQTILTTNNVRLHLVCDTKLQKYKHGAGRGFDIIRQNSPIRLYLFIYWLYLFIGEIFAARKVEWNIVLLINFLSCIIYVYCIIVCMNNI